MSEKPYPVYRLFFDTKKPDSRLGTEPMGSKAKFWLFIDKLPERPWLFKYARQNTGEHWAEKIASEVAKLLELPAQRSELAELAGGKRINGVIVESLIPHRFEKDSSQLIKLGELIHGNEVLAGRIENYEKSKLRKQTDHSWENICEALRYIFPEEQAFNATMRQFAGFLVLDAIIMNTDRHHENWALLSMRDEKTIQLAPSFDHASSLGRELTDVKRNSLLKADVVSQYIKKANGAIYGSSTTDHSDNPIELVRWATAQQPDWFSPWLKRLENIDSSMYVNVVKWIPEEFMSKTAKEFATALLLITTNTLKELRG